MQRLVILDLNGFLIHRVHERDTYELSNEFLNTADKHARPFFIWRRPHVDEFLEFLFEHFTVAIWTSARKYNAHQMVTTLIPDKERRNRLLFEWNQAQCKNQSSTLRTDAKKKFLFTKPLAKVWETFPQFDASNTLIIDDSPEKMVGNPPGVHLCPPPWSGPEDDDRGLCLDGEFVTGLRQHMFQP